MTDTALKVDLHNHNAMCNHADGTMEEYVLAAIGKGIEVFGFADHCPMEFDAEHRMTFAQKTEYEAEVARLKEKYSGRIEILLGYEVDWLPGRMPDEILSGKADYLIGSVHHLDEWGFDNPRFIDGYKDRNRDDTWREYLELMKAMAESRLFDIVAHLDLLKVFKFMPESDILLLAGPALEAIRDSGMAVEINASGYRKPIGEPYPSERLLREIFRLGIPITFGSDAHSVQHVGFQRDAIVALARRCGFTRCSLWRGRKMETVPF